MKFLRTILTICLVLFWCSCAGAATPARNVLILHSYHPGYPWTDQVMAGIQEVFSASAMDLRLHVEYLDTKKNPNPEYFSGILDAVLHYKLAGRRFDLVLLTDYEALSFSLAHRHDLFRGIPLVYCGSLENYPLEDRPAELVVVGEKPDYSGLLRLISRLHPEAQKLVVVGSTRDFSDRVSDRQVRSAAKPSSAPLPVVYWNDLALHDLAQRLRLLRSNAVVLINGAIRDDTGALLSPAETCLLLRENCGAPLYSPWRIHLGHGIVGGPLLDRRKLGHVTAERALTVLRGEDPARDILIVEADPPVFDHRELLRLRVDPVRLPAESELAFEPPGFYRLSREQGMFLFGALFISLAMTGLLTRTVLHRRAAEARLRESEGEYRSLSRQFRIILDGIPDGVTLISPDMKVIWSNKSAGNYSNRRLGTVPGEYCCKLLYNRASLCENCPAVVALKTGRNEEALIKTPDGRDLEVKAFPLKSPGGEVTHVILLAGDVTEKNKLREEAVRNSRLASLGELAAGIAHEINNPNALILLNASLVRKACGDAAPILQDHFRRHGDFEMAGLPYSEMQEELPHLFTEMLEGADRIRRIVADLKDFARPESSDMMERVDLNEVVRTAVRLLSNPIKNATHNLQTALPEGLPPMSGNFQKIEQVVVNLIMNACQALPDRECGIRLETGYDPDRGAVWLRVSDEGTGIAPEALPFVTDPFFTTKRESGGTGLGLSVSSRIIRDHGGWIGFASSQERGTTVTLRFPACTAPLEQVYDDAAQS